MRRLVFFAFFFVAPAAAEVAESRDIGQIESCLSRAGGDVSMTAHECIGTVSDDCGRAEGPGSAADCMLREADAWMRVGEGRLDVLRARSKPDIVAETEAAQAAWATYRDAQCNATGAFFYQYSGSASAEWQAACLRDLAAERTILLDDWAMRSEDFE
ncbi:lysozyme inhibitor LprI family protein [Oricola indica]|uniref:lysozyme inhibitor LprI family protein n=1 Tax=Oricola indica TaxID=2872591 RepID=UPI001CBC6875